MVLVLKTQIGRAAKRKTVAAIFKSISQATIGQIAVAMFENTS